MELDKLDKVALLARARESEAATALHREQQQLGASNERLDQLQSFKSEYEARLEAMGKGGIDARQLADYRRFLANLSDVIKMQSQEVDRSQERVEASRENFVDKTLRRGSVDELIGRSRAALAQQEARQEQKSSDESTLARYQRE
ncbi:MAG: flagellar export protein FliJ [Halieaceae bacterium]|jgi:flagellar FliJ protein|nr:flagellar export protein FliJ [Halieaceae bacterium]